MKKLSLQKLNLDESSLLSMEEKKQLLGGLRVCDACKGMDPDRCDMYTACGHIAGQEDGSPCPNNSIFMWCHGCVDKALINNFEPCPY